MIGDTFTQLLASEMLVLFAILAVGSWIGQISYKGIQLGAAGVLFTGLIFGHFGLAVPRPVMDLGLLLFVYAVGLQAGPRFFRTFRRHGIQYVVIALVMGVMAVAAAVVLVRLLRLPYDLGAGLFTGAMTCTPCLAAAIDVVERVAPGTSGNVSVGYGVAYPYSMIGLVILIQVLPRLLNRSVAAAEADWDVEKQAETPGLEARQFRVSNPNVDGRAVRDVNPNRMTLVNISRVKRGERVFAATPDLVLHQGDVVMVVGAEDELEKMRLLLGEQTQERMDVNTDVLSVDVEVIEDSLTGKRLAQMRVWETYTVVITRIRRSGQEITPTGSVTLEMGDTIRVVGERSAVERFACLVHPAGQRADETNMVAFMIGLVLGVALGSIPFGPPGGFQVRLGSAGGAFLVSLLVGHFGGIGRFRLYVPTAARRLSMELGLMLFLAGAGVNAGAQFVDILQEQGPALILAGALITTLSVLAGLVVMHRVYRMNVLSTMGALCACMTNPPGLGAANAQTETELPTLSYASVYPVALIFKIVLAQILVQLLRGLG